MDNVWEFLTKILKAINNFLLWYLNDTPLFEDTLNTLYALTIQTYNTLMPLVNEYLFWFFGYVGGVT